MLLFICDCAEMADLPVQWVFLTRSADINENALKKGGMVSHNRLLTTDEC